MNVVKQAQVRKRRKELYRKVDLAAAEHKKKIKEVLPPTTSRTVLWFEWLQDEKNRRWLDQTEDLRLKLQKQYRDMPHVIAKRRRDILETP